MSTLKENPDVRASVVCGFFMHQVINPIIEQTKSPLFAEVAQQRIENRIDTLKLPFAILGDEVAKLSIEMLSKETKISATEILPWRNFITFEDVSMFFKAEIENINDIFPDTPISVTNHLQAKHDFLLEYGSMALGDFQFEKVEQIRIKGSGISAFATVNGAKTGTYIVPINGETPFIELIPDVEFVDIYENYLNISHPATAEELAKKVLA